MKSNFLIMCLSILVFVIALNIGKQNVQELNLSSEQLQEFTLRASISFIDPEWMLSRDDYMSFKEYKEAIYPYNYILIAAFLIFVYNSIYLLCVILKCSLNYLISFFLVWIKNLKWRKVQ